MNSINCDKRHMIVGWTVWSFAAFYQINFDKYRKCHFTLLREHIAKIIRTTIDIVYILQKMSSCAELIIFLEMALTTFSVLSVKASSVFSEDYSIDTKRPKWVVIRCGVFVQHPGNRKVPQTRPNGLKHPQILYWIKTKDVVILQSDVKDQVQKVPLALSIFY